MLAVVYEGPRTVKVKDIQEPRAVKNHSVVTIKNASICGTDLHFYKGEWRAKKGIILGHDASGEVEETADRVVLEFQTWCGSCSFCLQGKQNLCERGSYMGFRRNGFFAEKVLVPNQNIYPLPEEVDFDEAACLEPAALALHTFSVLNPHARDWVTILGQGPVGLCMTQVAKLRKCRVIGVDLYDYRLDLAKKFGADHVVNAREEDVEKVVQKTTKGGSHFVIEAAGSRRTVEQTPKLVRADGRVALVGAFSGRMGFRDEVLFSSVMAYTISEKRKALKMVADDVIDLKSLISHRYPLREFDKAVKTAFDPSKRPVKILLQP